MQRKVIPLALILGLGVMAAPSFAFLGGPLPVFDASVFGKEVSAVANQASQISNEATQIRNQVSSLANEARNLAKLPTSFSNVQGEVSAVSAQANGIAAEVRGTVAANQILVDSSSDAAEAARVNGLAARADGAQQQAIVTNGYLSQMNNSLLQANVAAATRQQQDAANATDFATDLLTVTGNGSSTGSSSQPM